MHTTIAAPRRPYTAVSLSPSGNWQNPQSDGHRLRTSPGGFRKGSPSSNWSKNGSPNGGRGGSPKSTRLDWRAISPSPSLRLSSSPFKAMARSLSTRNTFSPPIAAERTSPKAYGRTELVAMFDREARGQAEIPSSMEAREQNVKLQRERDMLRQELFEAQASAERLQKALSRLRFDFEREKGDGLAINKLAAEQHRFVTIALLCLLVLSLSFMPVSRPESKLFTPLKWTECRRWL